MRGCTTLALILSLSACERASQPTQSPTPVPELPKSPSESPPPRASTTTAIEAPPPRPAISAPPKVEPKKPLPEVPCRARVCPEWKTPQLATQPDPPATEQRFEPIEVLRPMSRAYSPWRGEKPKVRIQKLPEAGK